eukprot:gene9295-biopygen9186
MGPYDSVPLSKEKTKELHDNKAAEVLEPESNNKPPSFWRAATVYFVSRLAQKPWTLLFNTFGKREIVKEERGKEEGRIFVVLQKGGTVVFLEHAPEESMNDNFVFPVIDDPLSKSLLDARVSSSARLDEAELLRCILDVRLSLRILRNEQTTVSDFDGKAVIGRDGSVRPVSFDAIKERILRLISDSCADLVANVDVDCIVMQTIGGMYDGITTVELDDLSARLCATMQSVHYAYDTVAACITMSNLAKRVRYTMSSHGYSEVSFSQKTAFLSNHGGFLFDAQYLEFVSHNADALNKMIVPDRDARRHGYFAFRTMERSYLLVSFPDELVIESPQDMWLRVAIAVNDPSKPASQILPRIQRCYDDMSLGLYTHATPTLFNAGTKNAQCSSCYLLGTEDSMDGIWTTLKNSAMISKWAGGIDVHVSNVRARGSRIFSTNGVSDGIVPMMRCYNDMVRYCNQAGRRKGSLAAYLEPWHADVWEFVELRRNTGSETERARDIFMLRVDSDSEWYLMSPDVCPDLIDAVGERFLELYNEHVRNKRYIRSMPARTLWQHIISCQLETGTPYMMFKDHVNRKWNQSNMGTIRSSNLCAEITEYSDSKSYAVCNLASIAVSSFVVHGAEGVAMCVDHRALHECAKNVTHNLNVLIDTSMYPVPETRESNFSLRPIGIGIQGLGDLYCILSLPYDDERAVRLDSEIMETIYHGATEASAELAEVLGPYKHFGTSPLAYGHFQFDL